MRMRVSDMIARVKVEERRKFAGRIVRDEIARQRMTQDEAAETARMSPSTLQRILKGEVLPDSPKLRALEDILALPDDLLRLVMEDDRKRIKSLHNEDIRPSLRRAILYELARIDDETVVKDEDIHRAQ